MPCLAGLTPLNKVVWLGYVTVGTTPCTPSAYVPSFMDRRRFGTFAPCASAAFTESGLIPSTEIRTSTGSVDRCACCAPALSAVRQANTKNPARKLRLALRFTSGMSPFREKQSYSEPLIFGLQNRTMDVLLRWQGFTATPKTCRSVRNRVEYRVPSASHYAFRGIWPEWKLPIAMFHRALSPLPPRHFRPTSSHATT